jgi:hypothetical protein
MRPGQSLDLRNRRCRFPVFLECFAARFFGFLGRADADKTMRGSRQCLRLAAKGRDDQ